MVGNPLTNQGTLNRLLASVIIPAFPELNVTSSFLGKEGVTISFQGDITLMIPTMTGTVTSPEPYQMATVLVRLLRTQPLADAFKQQLETTALIGDITVRPDSRALSPYQFINCAISTVGDLVLNGTDAGYGVSIVGYYPVNSSLFDG